jgi:quercetin dioxygenase-like cupin family protein
MEDGVDFWQLDLDGGERFVPLRRQLGVSTFGMNLIVLAPGQTGRIHRHARQEEVYLVLEGELSLLIEGEEHRLRAGGLVRVAPEVRRQLVNRRPQRVVLLALGGAEPHEGRDGEAFESWEASDGRPPQGGPAAGRRAGRDGVRQSATRTSHAAPRAPYPRTMPEGDTILRAANRIRPVLEGVVPDEILAPQPRDARERWPERLAGGQGDEGRTTYWCPGCQR